MKRFVLKAVLLATTLTITTTSFADQKNPRGSFGQRLSNSGIAGSVRNLPNSGNFQSNSGTGGTSGHKIDPRITTTRPNLNLPDLKHGSNNGTGTPIVRFPGNVVQPGKIRIPNTGNGNTGIVHLPNSKIGSAINGIPNLSNSGTGAKISVPHVIQLGQGKTTKPIAINPSLVLQNHLKSPQVQTQVQQIAAKAPKHLCTQPHFNWWVTVCHSHCHTHYGCWNIHDHYWDCWTPCHLNVVTCQQLSWYVGMSCVYIPDMQAYGVQSIVPGSPAQLAGLQTGDLILTVNGQSVFDANLINTEVARGRLELTFLRDGFATPLTTTILPQLVRTVNY